MKPIQLYQELTNLAEKIGLQVSEQNFRTAGIRVRSGFCRVKEQDCCIIDKHIKLNNKIEVLAECLNEMPLENIFILPAVREYLESQKPPSIAEGPPQEAEAEGSD
jgi:hypothetical protein